MVRGLVAELADNYVRIVRSELTGYGTSTRAEVLEEIAENVLDATKTRGAPPSTSGARHAGVPEPIVIGTLFRVRETQRRIVVSLVAEAA